MDINIPKDTSTKTILLVEDEAILAMNETEMLEQHGFSVVSAHNGDKAIELAESHHFDLILMDIDLGVGEMDGTEAAEIILKRHDVPIVFLSSHTEPEIVEKTEGITSYGYIVKTSGETVLIASIKMAFRLFEAKQEEKAKEKLLKQSEYKFKNIFNSTNEAIFITDMQGAIIEVNDTACTRLGYTREELLIMTAADLDGPESARMVEKRLELIDKDEKLVFEAGYKKKDGSIIPVEINCRKIDYENKACILNVARDITKRKQAEEKLEESNDNLLNLIENLPLAVFAHNLDGQLIQVNKNSELYTGYSREELLSMSVADIDKKSITRNDRETIWKQLKNGGVKQFQSEHIREDGSAYPAEISVSAITYRQEPVVLAIVQDITDRNQAEKLLQTIPDMMFLLDADGTYIDYKQDSDAILNVPPEAFLGKTVTEVLPKEIAEQILYNIRETIRTEQLQQFSHEMVLNNVLYSFETRMTFVDEDHVVSIARDVTEQKRTEEERDRYYNFLTSIISAVDSLLMVIDKNHHIHFCNWKDHEWVPQGIRGERPYCYEVMKKYSAPCDNCPPVKTFKDGKSRWYEDQNPMDGSIKEISVIPIFGSNGEVEYVLENVRDVTEQKKIEHTLKESEQRLKTILDKLPIPIVISSGNMETAESLNTKFTQLFGYTEKDIPDVFRWFEKAYPDKEYRKEVQAKWRRRIQEAAETESEVEPISVYITCKDGTVRYVSVRAFSSGDLHVIAFIDLTR